MKLILISAMTEERVIGSRNGLPWSLPDEYRHFLDHVRGHPVVMGRTSYEIFGPDLPDSPLVVVSRSIESLPDAEVRSSVEDALERAGELGDPIFSAGGGSIYRATLPLADAMYLSFVRENHPGDTHFPDFDEDDWVITRRQQHPAWEFRVYERRPGS